MQNKPQMVEAVLFYNEGTICKEMLYPEFEAVLDGVVALPEFADRQMHAVYVMINPRLQVRAAVFFCLDFNEDGSADDGWNIPPCTPCSFQFSYQERSPSIFQQAADECTSPNCH